MADRNITFKEAFLSFLRKSGGTLSGSLTVPVGSLFGSNPLLHVREEQPSGTNGGDFNSGAWRTRVLNTVVTNQITGASLAANQITLPEGVYFIQAHAPGNRVSGHKLQLYDTVAAAAVVIGASVAAPDVANSTTSALLSGQFTVGAGGAVLELQHQCQLTRTVTGLGNGSSFGVVEVYAEVLIWQLGTT